MVRLEIMMSIYSNKRLNCVSCLIKAQTIRDETFYLYILGLQQEYMPAMIWLSAPHCA